MDNKARAWKPGDPVQHVEADGVQLGGPIQYVERQEHTPREILIAYLVMKAKEEDWHAVADAAMDLRELDAKSRG